MAAPGPAGERAEFHSVNIYAGGITQGILLDLGAAWNLPASDRFEMLAVSYELSGEAATLAFCDSLGGDRPVRTTFAVDGLSIQPATREGLVLRRSPLFSRGDVNADGGLNIADAIAALGYVFGGAEAPACLDACDANDDGAVNVADAITILGHLFGDGSALPPPWPGCGGDPTADVLTCGSHAACATAP
jgi:hypothetical protein